MSGGSYSYIYCRVEEECVNRMFDPQLNEMMKDLVKVLHDLNKLRLMYKSKLNQNLRKQRTNC